jgi:hypothetical protein
LFHGLGSLTSDLDFKRCGGWDLNPRIPKEQGCRNQPAHSKLRTPFFFLKRKRDLRR